MPWQTDATGFFAAKNARVMRIRSASYRKYSGARPPVMTETGEVVRVYVLERDIGRERIAGPLLRDVPPIRALVQHEVVRALLRAGHDDLVAFLFQAE